MLCFLLSTAVMLTIRLQNEKQMISYLIIQIFKNTKMLLYDRSVPKKCFVEEQLLCMVPTRNISQSKLKMYVTTTMLYITIILYIVYNMQKYTNNIELSSLFKL